MSGAMAAHAASSKPSPPPDPTPDPTDVPISTEDVSLNEPVLAR